MVRLSGAIESNRLAVACSAFLIAIFVVHEVLVQVPHGSCVGLMGAVEVGQVDNLLQIHARPAVEPVISGVHGRRIFEWIQLGFSMLLLLEGHLRQLLMLMRLRFEYAEIDAAGVHGRLRNQNSGQ